MKKLFLLDGHALVYRAHYAFITRPLMNSKGWNVSCISGFTRVLLELMKKENPTHLAVAFDLPTPTFRHERYTPYKAQRESQPEDISFGIPYIKSILEAMNIPIVTKEGFEADDVIGTLALQAEKEGFDVFMMTPDKDFGQLVSDKVKIYKPAKSGNDAEVWGVKEVCDNWQIKYVWQVVDMLAMQGDAVDNIPGFPGIGPKTAATLLAQYETLENVIAHADDLKGKQQDIIKNFAEQAMLSKMLAKIETEVPIQFDDEAYKLSAYNNEKLAEIFKDLEFRKIAEDIFGTDAIDENGDRKQKTINAAQGNLFSDTNDYVPQSSQRKIETSLHVGMSPHPPIAAHSVADKNIANTPHNYILIDSDEAIEELITLLKAHSPISYDSETTGIDANNAQLVGLSFAVKPTEAYYIPVPEDQVKAQAIIEKFRIIFEDEKILKIGQNIKYDALVLRYYNVKLAGIYFDTMLAHYVMYPELRHGMNFLSETYLKYAPVSIETLIGKGKNQTSMRDAPLEQVKEYAAEDADVTFQLYNNFKPKLSEAAVENIFYDIEMPLVEVLTEMEFNGVRIDPNFLAVYSKELALKIKSLEAHVYELAGVKFNIASPKQVGEILFDTLKLPYRFKKTGKSDQYSTDEDKLTELAVNYPIARAVLDFRGASKLLNTYVDALPKLINPKTGRVHSSFNQALAATGRLSSNNPNLQNIPIKTEEGRHIRKAFIPRDANHVLVSADYSQIELRLIAQIAPEEAMLDDFSKGNDIHTATAARVYKIPMCEVTPTQRRNAKTVNFAIIYGAGATTLSQQLSIPRAEAKALIEAYFVQYPGLNNYMKRIVEETQKTYYVNTLGGRRRFVRDINSNSSLERSNAERIAINTPIQGSAADMIKKAMIAIHKTFKEMKVESKLILQVHDELVFEVPRHELDIVQPIIIEKMKNAIPHLRVPIEVGIGYGDNWLEAH